MPTGSIATRYAVSALLLLAVGAAVWLVVADPAAWPAAADTLLLGAATCAIALPPGTLLALLLVRTDTPGRGLAAAVLAVMLLVPLYLQAAGWDAGFGKLGWHSAAFGSLARPLLSGWSAAIWIHAMAAIPWVTLLVGVGVRLVEPDLEEDALLCGGPWSVFFRLTLPRACSSVAVAVLWVFVVTAGEMTVTNIYMVPNYAELVYTGFALGQSTYAVTLRVLPGIAVTALCVVAALVAVRHVTAAADQTALRPALQFRLGAWRWPAGLLVLALVLLVAGVPLADLAYQAGAELRVEGSERVRTWSVEKFAAMVGKDPLSNYRDEFRWTLLIAATAATCAVAVSIPLAWLARRRGGVAWLTFAAAAILLAIPGPLLGMLVNAPRTLTIFGRPPAGLIWLYDRTIFAPVLALTLRSFPIALLVCWYALRSLADDVLDAARTEGAGALTRLLFVAAPQRRLALAAAWLAALAIAAGDLSASILAVPPGISTIPILVFGMIHFGVTDQVAGVCLTSAFGYSLLGAAVVGLLARSRTA